MAMRLESATLFSFLLLSTPAFPCSCLQSPSCPELGGKTGPVFVGTVLTVIDLPRSSEFRFLSSRKARIKVIETFGGFAPDVREVDVLTGNDSGDCGVPFRPGDVYLIDASVGNDGQFHAGICSLTRRAEHADAALRILRLRRDGERVPSLIGRIAQYDRDFRGTLGTRPPKPLAMGMVRVKAGRGVYEARSDAAGLFEFYGLPSGEYSFVPDLPPNTTLSWYIGSDRPPGSFELRAGACEERNIDVFASGSVQGRILDSSGKLLPHAFVYILPADQKMLPESRQLYWDSQGKEGFFKFVHIPPGEYVVFVNPEDSLDPAFPYRQTFHPGVRDRASATIISMRGGEKLKEVDIRLKQEFEPRHLTVRVTWADGRLIRDHIFVDAKAKASNSILSHAVQRNSRASIVDLSIHPVEAYEVEASLICRYADERSVGPGATLVSNRLYLNPGDNQTELRLTIPATACPAIPGKRPLTDQ